MAKGGMPSQSPKKLPVYTPMRGSDGFLYCVHERAGEKVWIRYCPSTKWIKQNLK